MTEYETWVRDEMECPKVIRGEDGELSIEKRRSSVELSEEQEKELMECCSVLESLHSDLSSHGTNSSTFSICSTPSSNLSSLVVTPSSSPINDSVMITIDLQNDQPNNIYAFDEKVEVEFLDLDRRSRNVEQQSEEYFALTFMSLPPEVIENICSFLDCKTLLALKATCRFLRHVAIRKMRHLCKIGETINYIYRTGGIPGVEVIKRHDPGSIDAQTIFRFQGFEYSSTKMSQYVLPVVGWYAATDFEKEIMALCWTTSVLYGYSDVIDSPFSVPQLADTIIPPRNDDEDSDDDEDDDDEDEENVPPPPAPHHAGEDEDDVEMEEGYPGRVGPRGPPRDGQSMLFPRERRRLDGVVGSPKNFWRCLGKSKSKSDSAPMAEKQDDGSIKVSFWRNTEGMVLEKCLCLCQCFQKEKIEVVFRGEDGAVIKVNEGVEVLGRPTFGTTDECIAAMCFMMLWPFLIMIYLPFYISLAFNWVSSSCRPYSRREITPAEGEQQV